MSHLPKKGCWESLCNQGRGGEGGGGGKAPYAPKQGLEKGHRGMGLFCVRLSVCACMHVCSAPFLLMI